MATQGKPVIDPDEMRRLSAEMDMTPPGVIQQSTEPSYGPIAQALEPVREVFVGVPELKTFIVGYAFGGGTFALAMLILAAVTRLRG